ncbi:MAG: hypothetical protein IKP76_03175 [Bacilli bacterium]|nr:hypothetical protein [Bacilli bacterium]
MKNIICSNCGHEYSSELIHCPECGTNETIIKRGNFIATIIFLVVVLSILTIIGFGIYFALNPVDQGPAVTDKIIKTPF